MQIARIIVLLSLLLTHFLTSAEGQSSYQQQDTLGGALSDSAHVQWQQDSIRQTQDSIELLFATKYADLIFDNPHRTSYIEGRMEYIASRSSVDLLMPEEYVAQTQVDVQEGVEKETRPRWVIVMVFVLFLFVALIRMTFPTEFRIIIEAYYRERLLQQVSKEDSLATSWPYIFLYGVFSFALGLFLVVLFSGFDDAILLTPFNFLRASLIIAVLFILKIMVSRFISFVFNLEKIMREYIAVIYLVYFNSMLVLLPFLLFVVLIPVTYFNFLLIIFVVMVGIVFVYRVLRTSFHLFSETRISISYLILYLCTLEIAPILLLIRALGS